MQVTETTNTGNLERLKEQKKKLTTNLTTCFAFFFHNPPCRWVSSAGNTSLLVPLLMAKSWSVIIHPSIAIRITVTWIWWSRLRTNLTSQWRILCLGLFQANLLNLRAHRRVWIPSEYVSAGGNDRRRDRYHPNGANYPLSGQPSRRWYWN